MEMVGIPRETTGAPEPPEAWRRDVRAYFENAYGLTDPEFPDLKQPYAVTLKGRNPVAVAWQLHQHAENAMYILQPELRNLMITCDNALLKHLGEAGLAAARDELCERLAELVERGLIKAPKSVKMVGSTEEAEVSASMLSELMKAGLHHVSRQCFYSTDPAVRLRCVDPKKHLPTDEERLEDMRSMGEGDVVAVPLTFWVRYCDKQREG